MIQSDFGKKLFRLLLLFALLPSLIIVAWGYYLSRELAEITNQSRPDYTLALIDYFHAQQDSRLRTLADNVVQTDDEFFALTISPSGVSQFGGKQLLTDYTIEKLLQSSKSRPTGLIHVDSSLLQYMYLQVSPDSAELFGVLYTAEYTSLLDSLQYDLTQIRSEQHLWQEYSSFLFILFLSIFVVATFVAYRLSAKTASHLAEPLSELAQATELIAAGSFDQSVRLRGSGEVRQLIENFNDMAIKLRQTTDRLTQAERVAAWRHLARRFAHELRNPLQPITISLYRIEKFLDGLDMENVPRDAIRATREEVNHLTELAERFSTLAKLPPPKLSKADVGSIVNSVVTVFRERLADYNFTITLPDKLSYALIDATYFREAIQNLIINAMDATEQGDKIEITLMCTTDSLFLKVRDNGSGMDEDTLRSARMPYFTTKQSGSGIGLAIVEKTVAEMNGHLSIDSEAGKGTTVTISLPRVNN